MSYRNSEGLQHTIIRPLPEMEKYYVAECLEVTAITQGKARGETIANLKEGVALHVRR
jgi:predicted RNase H-like HicB family nuclease